MDLWFIGFLVALVVAAGFFVSGRRATKERDKRYAKSVGTGVLIFAGLLFIMSCFVIIPTKHIGVEVFGGKPGSTFTNGFHLKNPLATVERFDGTVQTEQYSTDKDDEGEPIGVRISNGSTATLNVTYQWRLSDEVNDIYRNYPTASTSDLNKNVVKRDVQQALNDAYAAYDPYAPLLAQQAAQSAYVAALAKGGATPPPPPAALTSPATTYQAYGKQAASALTAELGPQEITFVSMTIASITLDGPTQDRINQLSQSIIATSIAIQNEATAVAQAAANATISKNPPTTAQNIQACLALTQKLLEEGHVMNTFWNCIPGSAGGSAAVNVPQ